MDKHNVLIALCITLFFCITRTMDIEISDLKDLKALLWIDKSTLALASTDGLFLLKDMYCSNRTLEKIHDYPTDNLITNQAMTLIGCMCPERFIAYNATTFKEFWSKRVYNNAYTATFGPNESIFVRNDEKLYSNTFNDTIMLPFTGADKNFGITCHPTQLKIAYPSHGGVITKRSFVDDKSILNDYFGEESIPHPIICPIYSPDGNHMILRLENKQIIIYDAIDKSKIKHPSFLGYYYNMNFFDESTLALMYNYGAIDFLNYKTKTTIAKARSLPSALYVAEHLANIFDFSPHKRHLAAIVGKDIAIRATPLALLKKQFVCIYWLIQQYFCYPAAPILPIETARLIMHWLIAPHT